MEILNKIKNSRFTFINYDSISENKYYELKYKIIHTLDVVNYDNLNQDFKSFIRYLKIKKITENFKCSHVIISDVIRSDVEYYSFINNGINVIFTKYSFESIFSYNPRHFYYYDFAFSIKDNKINIIKDRSL